MRVVFTPKSRSVLTAMVLAATLSACGASENATSTRPSATRCVPLPEGEYIFQNGKFQPSNTAVVNMTETTAAAPGEATSSSETQLLGAGWASRLKTEFSELGYDWMDLEVRNQSAILTGVAPDPDTKAAGFNAGRSAILASTDQDESALLIVDGIDVEGGRASVGAALLALDNQPDIAACENAFAETLQERTIQFRTGSAVIQSESDRLIDTTAGIAIQCQEHDIEIGGHTDDIGEDLQNLSLSQRRAEAVQSQLIQRGVPGAMLTAVGYGETRPLDESGTREARAKNRRTEFKVTRRPGGR
ncbi:MAG: OmpA family protein [Pseudomonadota bacterium]